MCGAKRSLVRLRNPIGMNRPGSSTSRSCRVVGGRKSCGLSRPNDRYTATQATKVTAMAPSPLHRRCAPVRIGKWRSDAISAMAKHAGSSTLAALAAIAPWRISEAMPFGAKLSGITK